MNRWIQAAGKRLASPTGLALTYLAFGAMWIFTSDRVLEGYATERVTLTDLQTYKGWAYISVTAAMLYGLMVTMVARLGSVWDRLRETRENFRRLVESSHDGMWAVDAVGQVVVVNARLEEILGVKRDQLLQRGVDESFVPETVVRSSAPGPEGVGAVGEDEMEGRRRESQIVRFHRADGRRGWGIVSRMPLTDGNGAATGELRVLTDITRTKEVEEALRESLAAERMLLNELDHRVRNNLASLLTLIELSKRGARDVSDFAGLISGRVGAMAATHSLLAETKFATVDLTRLISVITDAEQEHRLARAGPPVMLGPSQAAPMAMILQELWANSVKHGALGGSGGTVRVGWELIDWERGGRGIRVEWNDVDGPPVHAPERYGFGLSMVRGLSQSDLHGRFDATFPEAGAKFVIEFPLNGNGS